MPSPLLALTQRIVALGFKFLIFSFAFQYQNQNIICIYLEINTRSQTLNIKGYFNGLSSPSGTDKIIRFLWDPVSNSAGQTRFPIFSRKRRSKSSTPNSSQVLLSFLPQYDINLHYEFE